MNTPTLSTLQIFPPVPQPITPPQPPAITIPAPLSYEFRVVEIVENNKITSVELQVKVNQHDQWGNVSIHGTWNPVPRVQITKPEPK